MDKSNLVPFMEFPGCRVILYQPYQEGDGYFNRGHLALVFDDADVAARFNDFALNGSKSRTPLLTYFQDSTGKALYEGGAATYVFPERGKGDLVYDESILQPLMYKTFMAVTDVEKKRPIEVIMIPKRIRTLAKTAWRKPNGIAYASNRDDSWDEKALHETGLKPGMVRIDIFQTETEGAVPFEVRLRETKELTLGTLENSGFTSTHLKPKALLLTTSSPETRNALEIITTADPAIIEENTSALDPETRESLNEALDDPLKMKKALENSPKGKVETDVKTALTNIVADSALSPPNLDQTSEMVEGLPDKVKSSVVSNADAHPADKAIAHDILNSGAEAIRSALQRPPQDAVGSIVRSAVIAAVVPVTKKGQRSRGRTTSRRRCGRPKKQTPKERRDSLRKRMTVCNPMRKWRRKPSSRKVTRRASRSKKGSRRVFT